jgi:hypothetical protein
MADKETITEFHCNWTIFLIYLNLSLHLSLSPFRAKKTARFSAVPEFSETSMGADASRESCAGVNPMAKPLQEAQRKDRGQGL